MIDGSFRNFDHQFIRLMAGECNADFAFCENLSKPFDVSQDTLIKGVTVAIFDGDVPYHVNKQVNGCSFLRWRSPPEIALLVKMGYCLSYTGNQEFEHHFV